MSGIDSLWVLFSECFFLPLRCFTGKGGAREHSLPPPPDNKPDLNMMNRELEDSPNKPWQVERYEELSREEGSVYFDVDDFEEIIDYYLFQGSFKDAMLINDYAINLHPASIPLMLKKAQTLAAVNQEDFALKILTDVENIEPSNHDVFLTKGAIYSQLRNYEKAIEEYNKAVFDADEPDYVYCNIAFEYENLGNFDKTLEYLGKALDVNPDNDLAIYEAAYCFDLLSLTDEGITFFHRLIDRNPYSSEAWFNLGVSYINAGSFEKALEALDYALTIDDQHEHSWFHKGYVLNLMERYSEAIEAFDQSIIDDDEETDPMKFYYMGECYEKMKEYTLARELYNKVIHIDPAMSDAWIGLGICDLEDEKPSHALQFFKKGLELDPENVSYLALLANTYFTLGKTKDGSKTYEKALVVDPSDSETWIEYAEVVASKKQVNKAVEIIRSGMESIPGNTNLTYLLSAFLFLDGKPHEAIYYLEEALSADFQGHNSLLEKYPQLLIYPSFLDAIERYRL